MSALAASSGASTARDGTEPELRDGRRRIVDASAKLGLAGSAAWIVLGVESTVLGGERHYRDVLWFVPWATTAACFVGLYVTQRDLLPRWGRIAFGVLGATMGLVMLGQVGVIVGNDALLALGFPGGAMLWLAALVPVGVATYRAKVLPRRVGVLVAALEPLSIMNGILLSPIAGLHDRGNYSGGIAKGLVVLVAALALRAWVRTSENRAARQRDGGYSPAARQT